MQRRLESMLTAGDNCGTQNIHGIGIPHRAHFFSTSTLLHRSTHRTRSAQGWYSQEEEQPKWKQNDRADDPTRPILLYDLVVAPGTPCKHCRKHTSISTPSDTSRGHSSPTHTAVGTDSPSAPPFARGTPAAAAGAIGATGATPRVRGRAWAPRCLGCQGTRGRTARARATVTGTAGRSPRAAVVRAAAGGRACRRCGCTPGAARCASRFRRE